MAPHTGSQGCWDSCLRGGHRGHLPGRAGHPVSLEGHAGGSGQGVTGHKAHYDNVLRGRVPETLGHSHPSANKDTMTARKIEYKSLIQEIEAYTLTSLGESL